MTRAFVEREAGSEAREAGSEAREAACILCGDPATHGDLCADCRGAHDLASEHPVPCRCGACLVHAKIESRRAAVRS